MTDFPVGSRVRVTDAGAEFLDLHDLDVEGFVGVQGTVVSATKNGYTWVLLDDPSLLWLDPSAANSHEGAWPFSPGEVEPIAPPFVHGKWGEEPDITEAEKADVRRTMRLLNFAILAAAEVILFLVLILFIVAIF
jgi:hypothetical protein